MSDALSRAFRASGNRYSGACRKVAGNDGDSASSRLRANKRPGPSMSLTPNDRRLSGSATNGDGRR